MNSNPHPVFSNHILSICHEPGRVTKRTRNTAPVFQEACRRYGKQTQKHINTTNETNTLHITVIKLLRHECLCKQLGFPNLKQTILSLGPQFIWRVRTIHVTKYSFRNKDSALEPRTWLLLITSSHWTRSWHRDLLGDLTAEQVSQALCPCSAAQFPWVNWESANPCLRQF